MFERFTDRARRVVVLAQQEARMLMHGYIGTEHILLGLINEAEGVAARALESLDISLEAVRQQIVDIIGPGEETPTGHIPFTPRAKKVLELSLREALQLGHNYIGTEHILLGLMKEGEGVAAQVLVRFGAPEHVIRERVIELLKEYAGGEQTEPRMPIGEAVRRTARASAQARARRLRPEEMPACAGCGASLADGAAVRTLEVNAEDGPSSRPVTFVYCSRCGRALGTLQG